MAEIELFCRLRQHQHLIITMPWRSTFTTHSLSSSGLLVSKVSRAFDLSRRLVLSNSAGPAGRQPCAGNTRPPPTPAARGYVNNDGAQERGDGRYLGATGWPAAISRGGEVKRDDRWRAGGDGGGNGFGGGAGAVGSAGSSKRGSREALAAGVR